MSTHIVVGSVDDNVDLNFLTQHYFELVDDIEVVTFLSPRDAMRWDGWGEVSLCIVDYMMPEYSGSQFGQWLRLNYPNIIQVLLTATRATELTTEEKETFTRIIEKPYRPSELVEIIRELVGVQVDE